MEHRGARRPPLEALRRLDAVLIDLAGRGRPLLHLRNRGALFSRGRRARPAQRSSSSTVPIRSEARLFRDLSPTREGELCECSADPVRHGMTLGELARYLNGEYKLHAR